MGIYKVRLKTKNYQDHAIEMTKNLDHTSGHFKNQN